MLSEMQRVAVSQTATALDAGLIFYLYELQEDDGTQLI
jgi:hypothetical protein